MPDRDTEFAWVIAGFAGYFSRRVWRHAPWLLIGAMLTPGALGWGRGLQHPG